MSRKVIALEQLARFKEKFAAAPYVVQDYELDLEEETFSCSDADAEYIFQNNPVAISLDGTIAIARRFTDDDRKNDHIRSYTLFEFPDDDQIIYYELGLYWDGEEYSSDVKPTEPIGGGSGGNVSDLYLELEDEPTQAQLEQIYTQKPDVLRLGMDGGQHIIVLHKSLQSASETRLNYFNIQNGAGDIQVLKIEYSEEDGYIAEPYEWSLDSIVSGTNDGTNWTSLTIGDETYDIPQGGGGGTGTDEIYPIAITAIPSSINIELASAQNFTLQDMPDAPGYTYAAYTLNAGLSYTKPYDAVLAEFGAGHQYLLPLISADSSMLLYGIEESGMPVFDDEHPCVILIQLNNGAIDAAMMISGGTYGPSGKFVDTSLKGYFYSDTVFSFNAGGISDTDIAAAISAGKLPVAIIDWKYKDYQSWCPIKSFDEDDYYFEGEYKENKFTLLCDGSYWRNNWSPVYVEDKELDVYIDYTNNLVYFRSLNDLREAQAGNTMLRLKLYSDASHTNYLGKLELTLASQNAAGTENYYSVTQVDNDDIKVTELIVTSSDTLSGGSQIKQVLAESGGSGTEVVANPTLEGTESDLIGLEVDGTKYRVPQFEIQSNLKGKKISFIGDSITTYSGYLPSGNVSRYPRGAITNVDQTWWKQLIDQTGMVLGQNCAWDGSTCIGRSTSTTNAYGACSAKRISQLGLNGNPDIIICFIGINDWGATYNNTGTHYGSPFTNGAFVPVGSYTGETAAPSGDLQTFSEAYGSMLYNIQVNYPNAKIYCCTLLQTNGKATYNYDADGVFPSINRNSVTLASYNECIRTLAKNIGAEIIEFAKCGINWGNMSTYLEDGLHPNVAGMRLLCASAKAKLEADFGYTTESFTPLQTFSVTNNLTNVVNSNNATTASENTTYSASLTADVGYTISSVTITMGGIDITSSAYSGGAINIGNVTGNIVITASATLNVYSITNSLTNVTNSNQATSINHGNSYSATLTIPSGYTMQSVSIQMGGVDITSSVYSNNEISISSVTGNIIITAVATDQVTYSITNNLSNVTNSNASVSIVQGDSYTATLTPSTHYELQTANVSILMGGTDVTGTVYDGSNRTISISNVTGALIINATATIISHTITNTLTHTTNSNNAVSANDGSSYSGTLTADTGYNISSVSVIMGGVDITSTAYNNGVITISSVTGDIVIQCVSTAVVYSITNNLTNATSDNAATTINYGSSYSATITPTSGYEITSASVTMGGVDITNTAYDNGVISIASVTGNLVITITALDPTAITWYTNFSQTSTNSFVASSRGWALDETTYANIYNKPINRISLVATASSGSIDICVAPSYNAQSGFTQQQTINWTSANKSGNIVTLELDTPITLATGEYLCVYVNSTPASGAACYASGGGAGQFYSYVGASGHGSWGSKGSYSIQMNIGYKA